MRILIHDRSGHPFQVQLSRELARRGYTVMHSYGSFFQTPKGALTKRDDDPETFNVMGINLDEEFAKYSLVKRRFQEMEYARRLLTHVNEFNPDVAVWSNVPPDPIDFIYRKRKDTQTKNIFWVQDLYGVAIKKILNKKIPFFGTAVGGYYNRMEHQLLRHSDKVVLITEDFRPLMHEWGVAHDRIEVIPNWAPNNEITARPKVNEWSQLHGISDKFIFLYSGTLGMKHNPDILIKLAQAFETKDDVKVVVISEGKGADYIHNQIEELNLTNLVLLPFQPYSQFSEVLGSADVLMALLEKDAGIFSVPSKVLSYLCSERSLLLAVAKENLAARIVKTNQTGYASDPENVEQFVQNATKLYENAAERQQFAKNGRDYADVNFDIVKIADKFEKLIVDSVGKGRNEKTLEAAF